ncbi:hypothetical protein BLIN9172_00060 [Brevibacterium linens ATCC 9172]
MGNEN